MSYMLVALGGAIGSVARYAVGLAVLRAWGDPFPLGTLLINVAGSFVIGLAGVAAAHPETRTFVMVGLCGGFTTFSAFSLQTVELAKTGLFARAAVYVALSVLLCLVAVIGGAWLGGAIRTR